MFSVPKVVLNHWEIVTEAGMQPLLHLVVLSKF